MKKNLYLCAFLICSNVSAEIRVGSVAIYSNGSAEKLIEKNKHLFLWEDQRKRLFTKSLYPVIPVLKYQRYPDPRSGYSQKVAFGTPEKMIPFGDLQYAKFEMNRVSTSSGKTTRHWRCEYQKAGKYRLGKKSYQIHNYECVRLTIKKMVDEKIKEKHLIKYSPELGLVVERKITDSKGKKKRVKLVQILEPGKATAKRISRTIYKMRSEK